MNDKYPMACVYASPERMETSNSLGNFSVTLENGDTIELTKPYISIGRSNSCDVTINDPGVSRNHAHLYNHSEHWFLYDDGSKNGTWINNVKIDSGKPYALNAGDVISLAHHVSLLFKRQIKGSAQIDVYPFIHVEPMNERFEDSKERPIMATVYGSPQMMQREISDKPEAEQREGFLAGLFKRKP